MATSGGGGGRAIKVLNVAEKPSVAKTVSRILSRNQLRTREGRSPYNKIFEFNYMIGGQQCQMMFTSVTGHLMEIEFDGRCQKWHSCDPVDLFHASIQKHVPHCKNVIWLPGSVSEATVCNTFTPGPIFKIQLKFHRLEIPPQFNVNYLGCVGDCDDILNEIMEMSNSGRRTNTSTPARGQGIPAAPPRNGPHNNQPQQQATCSFCHQTGHSSSDCYSLTSQNRSIPVSKRQLNWQDKLPTRRGGGSYSDNGSNSAVTTSRRGGRGGGRGRGGANGSDGRFVSATGDHGSG